ncbi:MAG: hypothetical protein R2787_11060 [Saprospiraceae bacterium]
MFVCYKRIKFHDCSLKPPDYETQDPEIALEFQQIVWNFPLSLSLSLSYPVKTLLLFCRTSWLVIAMLAGVAVMLTNCKPNDVFSPAESIYKNVEGDLKVKHPYGGFVYLDEDKLLAGYDVDPADAVIQRSKNDKLKNILAYKDVQALARYVSAYVDKDKYFTISWSDIRSQFPDLDPSNSAYPEECDHVYDGYVYKTVVYFVNEEWADTTLLPIFSDGIIVEDDTLNNDHDQVLCYALEQDSSFTAMLLGERSFKNETRPIYSIDLEVCGIDSTSARSHALEPFADHGGVIASPRSNPGTATNEYRINHRYDKSSHSEFEMSYVRIRKVENDWEAEPGSQRIDNVHKKNIGKDLGKWRHWTSQSPLGVCTSNPPEEWAFVYNTYEYDWINSPKDLGKTRVRLSATSHIDVSLPAWHSWSQWQNGVPVNGGGRVYGGNRRYASEWYTWEPGIELTLPNCHLKVQYFCDPCWGNNQYGWAHTQHFDQSKGYLTWWKVQ